MAAMRRGLVHALAWSLATGAAVTLSWWGVHTVMAGTAYDPPLALPIPAAGSGSPKASSTQHPPTPAPSKTPRKKTPPPPSPTPQKPTTQPPSPDAGRVKSYTVDGGRVVFALGETSAELVSATPSAGWQMQVWKQPTWIRVTFTRDAHERSVFAVWHDSAPRVEIDER
ncbi:hypothetical protein ACGFMM_21530 [Streptomyces sp. NPDC048604]|uniref:hypothetical protein n=1 Tax=Streptomyces sp. NPDC048604 TaxID=3365578 RepID=UPI003719057D